MGVRTGRRHSTVDDTGYKELRPACQVRRLFAELFLLGGITRPDQLEIGGRVPHVCLTCPVHDAPDRPCAAECHYRDRLNATVCGASTEANSRPPPIAVCS